MVQFIANGICNAAVYSLVAIGFGLIFYATKTFHIAHGGIYTFAGFICYAVLIPLGWPLSLAIIIGIVAGTVLGLLIEVAVYYPLVNPRKNRNASPAILMISSLGAYIIVVNIIAIWAGNDTKVLRPGVEMTINLWGAILTQVQVAQILIATIGIISLATVLRFTHLGRTIRALADDAELISTLGYNIRALRLAVFAVGSSFAGVGSILTALDVGIDPQVGFHAVLVAAVATIIGGFGRLLAPAFGALILGLLQSIVIWQTSQKWSSAVVFAVLVLVLLFRPQGLLASKKRLEEE
jgi:branched-chain amino acid transport system permease protein